MFPGVRCRTSTVTFDFQVDSDFLSALSVGKENRNLVAIFVTSWIALLSDSPLDPHNKPIQLYRRFVDALKRDGLKETVVRYSSLAHRIVSKSTIYGTGSLTGDWVDEMKDTPVFFEYNRYYQTGDPKILEFLYTFLNFGKKLDYYDKEFESVAFRDWLGIEDKLRSWEYDAEDVLLLKHILSALLPRFTIEDFRPKFGPGSVAERGIRGRIGKIRSFQYVAILDRFFFHGYLGRYSMGEEFGLSPRQVLPDERAWSSDNEAERIARLIFARKNLKTARSVCMEPSSLMYFQQGTMREVLRTLGTSIMSRFIDIKDQSRNRLLSLYGSYTGNIDTIDLSAASDSVSLRLVKGIFPPSWLIPMLATRSHSACVPDGRTVRLHKFAPMGSALCFPTQCIVFTAVCIYAACLYRFKQQSVQAVSLSEWLTDDKINQIARSFHYKPDDQSTGFQPLAVYGDDICVDSKLTPIVKAILVRLGFDVNEEKSFVASQAFRESCGGFYLNGHDITPVLFRVRGVRGKVTASHVASQVQLANSLYKAKRFNCASYLRRCLDEWGGRKLPLPYVHDDRWFGHLCQSASNNHLKRRTSPDRLTGDDRSNYQRDELRVWTISYDSKESDADLLFALDNYEYMRWWSSRSGKMTEESKTSVSRSDTSGSRIRWRWIPAYQ